MPIIVRKQGVVLREKLRKFLRDQLILIKENTASAELKAHEPLLRKTLEGVKALEYGEVQPIFVPRETTKTGKTPYRAAKYRAIAVGFIDLLRAKKHKDKDARDIVAKAYSVDHETVKSWRNELDEINDPEMKSFRNQIANSAHWDEARVLEELKTAAYSFKFANKKKNENKKQNK